MKIVPICLFFIVASCAPNKIAIQPLGYSYFPKYVEIDSMGGSSVIDSNLLSDSSLTDFKSIPLDSGKLTTIYETKEIPAGILISDKKAVQLLLYKAHSKSLSSQLMSSEKLRRSYYDKSKEAEELYQKQILDLRKAAERTWFEKNSGYIGFTAGMVATIAAGIVVSKVSK